MLVPSTNDYDWLGSGIHLIGGIVMDSKTQLKRALHALVRGIILSIMYCLFMTSLIAGTAEQLAKQYCKQNTNNPEQYSISSEIQTNANSLTDAT